MSNSLTVRKNSKGFGVYTNRIFKKGEIIARMSGRKVKPQNLSYHLSDFRNAITNPLQVAVAEYLDLDRPYRLINHSCKPNTALKGTATLFALKSIKRGEEITYDYSATIDESFICKCGSRQCRGTVVDFFGLPKKVQQYYFRNNALQNFIRTKLVRLYKGMCPCGSRKRYRLCHKI